MIHTTPAHAYRRRTDLLIQMTQCAQLIRDGFRAFVAAHVEEGRSVLECPQEDSTTLAVLDISIGSGTPAVAYLDGEAVRIAYVRPGAHVEDFVAEYGGLAQRHNAMAAEVHTLNDLI